MPGRIVGGVIHRTDDPETFESTGVDPKRPPEVYDYPVTVKWADGTWTLELYRKVEKRTRDGVIVGHKWVAAADFQRGKTMKLDEAMQEVTKRQKMAPENNYRIRDLQNNEVILASILV